MKRLLLIGMPNRSHSREVIVNLQHRGYHVVTVDTVSASCFHDIVEASLIVPNLQRETVLEIVYAYHAHTPIHGVARFHELAVPISNEIAVVLGLPHFPVDRIAGCTNKYIMRRWMRDHGVPCPDFGAAHNLQEAHALVQKLGFPVVIKPQVGGASFGVTRLDNELDVQRFFQHIDIFWEPRSFIIEQYMEGSEVSVETITFERPTHVALFEKPQALDGPFFLEHTFITPGQHDQAMVDATYQAVSLLIDRLGLQQCVTHTELRLTDHGPVVLEFGLRPIGYPGPLCVQQTTGIDLIEAMACIAVGQDSMTVATPASPYCGWRYLTVPRSGRLCDIGGAMRACSIPGVLSCHFWVQPGQLLRLPPQGFNYILGYVVAAGATFAQVHDRLSQAQAAVQITIE